METKQARVVNIYFHISNGGINFEVLQNESTDPDFESKSPVLKVSAHHFGHQTNGMEFQLRPEALQALGEALIAASKLVVFEGEFQVVVENPQNIIVGNEVWNKSEPCVLASSDQPDQYATG